MSDPIVVCGAGIVGLSAALGLSRAGLDTVLVAPKQPLPSKAPGVYCPRVYALSPASQRFLAEQGVWDMLDPQRITAVESMQIYGDASGQVSLNAWQAAHDQLAWIIESDELERVLRQAVQLFRVNWLDDRFENFAQRGVSLASGKSISAPLVIGAEGGQSVVRQAAGIAHHSKPYGYAGVVTHLRVDRPHQGTAFQWFTSDGIIAFLPMPDTSDAHQVSLVWSMPQDQADTLMALDAAARAEWLALRLKVLAGHDLGTISVRSAVYAFPLFCEYSDMVAPGVVLVGDAAHRVHPLAGQGLNLGLGDVQELLHVLVSKESYRSPGDMRVLSRYRRARAEPVLAMRTVTDGLHRLFAVQAPPVVMVRNLGMQLVDRLPWVKRRLIQGASR
ncbi:FAD-dependent monooxygenase [Pusillimonas sp. NJUB218]|uniref:FAD-dependent monooxygenase n=1 Tax=Pusillimonas sp. NJUB218 TaxID=2023230 RepID=UPI000F4CD6F8|nr:FAD-dependent monooxygenase [Pusillimonas sp. NJUB218]ROT45863.1 ubiquinone biosynthesis protein UbiH [Pusillimonas sp. NJUB218]